MTNCPHCRRRLLSHASAKCNWCGLVIGDRDYQTNAQAEREAYFLQQAQHDAQSLSNVDTSSVSSPAPFRDPFATRAASKTRQRPMVIRPLTYENQPTVAPERNEICRNEPVPPSTDAGVAEPIQQGRFQHLELG